MVQFSLKRKFANDDKMQEGRYLVPLGNCLEEIWEMMDEGEYFSINKARYMGLGMRG